MEVVVLLKQVPSTESEIKIAEDGRSIQELDIKWVINPYDEFAIEEALRIREAEGGTVTILSVGPERTGKKAGCRELFPDHPLHRSEARRRQAPSPVGTMGQRREIQ